MYANLKFEMGLNKVTIEDISKTLKLHRNSISNKINGGNFTVEEAFQIQKSHFPQLEVQYLFKKAAMQNLDIIDSKLLENEAK